MDLPGHSRSGQRPLQDHLFENEDAPSKRLVEVADVMTVSTKLLPDIVETPRPTPANMYARFHV